MKYKYRLCWHDMEDFFDLERVVSWKQHSLEYMKLLCDHANKTRGGRTLYWVEKRVMFFFHKKVYGK